MTVGENSPADFVTIVAANLLAGEPDPEERATAELLQAIVDTWAQQPGTVRKRAVAVASALARKALS